MVLMEKKEMEKYEVKCPECDNIVSVILPFGERKVKCPVCKRDFIVSEV